jgi:hypothetical protein
MIAPESDVAAKSRAMTRLWQLASDAGKPITRHSFINPDEAAEILAEIQRLETIISGDTLPLSPSLQAQAATASGAPAT